MIKDGIGQPNRRAVMTVLAGGLFAAMSAPALATPSINSGKGIFRRIKFINPRLEERLDSVYWIDGEYVPEALTEISGILRDWRAEKVKSYHPRVLDVLSAAHRKLDTDQPFEVVSGYRCPATNAAMRRESRGVAKNSYHVLAMAVDVKMDGRSTSQIARAGHSLEAGGVGTYSRSGFVHMDCGPVRTWGR